MKKILYVACILSSISSLKAVEIINNTQKKIKFEKFETIGGRKVMIYPFTLNPGETHKDRNIASFNAKIKYEAVKEYGNAVFEVAKDVIDHYRLTGLQEDSIVSFVVINDIIEAHRFDKSLPWMSKRRLPRDKNKK